MTLPRVSRLKNEQNFDHQKNNSKIYFGVLSGMKDRKLLQFGLIFSVSKYKIEYANIKCFPLFLNLKSTKQIYCIASDVIIKTKMR